MGAESLNLAFSEFHLPPTATLTIADPTGRSQAVTFTSRDNDAHGQLWTPIFATDELLVSLELPTALVTDYRLRLAKTNHGFRSKLSKKFSKAIGTSTSGSCNIDVVCRASDNASFGPLVDMYRDQIRSVAAYTLRGTETCSGALINNTRNDLTPYFLTADHCGINSSNASSIVVYWNFENSTCRPPNSSSSGANGNGPITQFNTGSIFRAARANSDFCLIELDDPVDPSVDPFYAGWNRSGDNPEITVGIHHPGVSEKRISFELDPTRTTSAYSSSSIPNGTHVRVSDWDFGTTEGGSSGSPLFDDAGHIIGQLEGGDAACGNNLSDWYGRISRSWADGGNASSQLSDWLAPDNAQPISIDGINAIRVVSIGDATVTEGDSGTTTVEVTLTLSEATSQTVSVIVTAVPGSASRDDFVELSQRVSFVRGQTSRTVSVGIVGDTSPEENETFNLVLSDAVNADASTQPGRFVILNDDFTAPTINSPLSVQIFANSFFEYQITAFDTPTSFSLSDAPEGMRISRQSGTISWTPPSVGTETVTIIATNAGGSDSRTLTLIVNPNSLAAALELTSTVDLSNIAPGWYIQSDTTSDGIDAAQANRIGDSQTASFTLDVIGPDLLEYRYKVSSEESSDFLSINLDGQEQEAFSGEINWQSGSLVIPAGPHTIAFSYIKDGSVSEGEDTAWLDSFNLVSSTGRPALTSPTSLFIDSGNTLEYIIESIAIDATFTITGLPAELSFDNDRTITGTLATPATYSFQVRALSDGQEDILDVSIRVSTPVGDSVELANLSWTREGEELWFGQSNVTSDGIDAAQSGNIGNSESATMSITVTGPDRMTFQWKVSSEEGSDELSFLLDNQPFSGLPAISGEQDWTLASVVIPSGTHILSWRYAKDTSSRGGQDTAWVDDLRLATGRLPMIWLGSRRPLLRSIPGVIPLEFINSDSFSIEGLPAWLTYREETDELIGTPPNGTDIEFTTSASGGGEIIPRTIPFIVDIPSNSLAASMGQRDLAVVSEGDATWIPNPSPFLSNPRTRALLDNQSSRMTLLLQGPGTLQFSWSVDSEENSDFLSYSLNDQFGARISGEVNWQQIEIDLAPGQNEVTWTYQKDDVGSQGEDYGQIREVILGGYARFLKDQNINHYSSRPTDDRDGNGLPIIAEYAFGIAPGSPAGFPLLSLTPHLDETVLQFEAPNPPSDIIYLLEASADLDALFWNPVRGEIEITPTDSLNQYRLPITIPRANTPNRFYRMRISFQ